MTAITTRDTIPAMANFRFSEVVFDRAAVPHINLNADLAKVLLPKHFSGGHEIAVGKRRTTGEPVYGRVLYRDDSPVTILQGSKVYSTCCCWCIVKLVDEPAPSPAPPNAVPLDASSDFSVESNSKRWHRPSNGPDIPEGDLDLVEAARPLVEWLRKHRPTKVAKVTNDSVSIRDDYPMEYCYEKVS